MPLKAGGLCPCHSGRPYQQCCAPFHNGRHPATPALLMRARYAAYALGNARFIMSTTHPGSPLFKKDKQSWRREVKIFCAETSFIGLHIISAAQQSPQQGEVTFYAALAQAGKDASFTERSLFKKEKERWYYFSALD